MGKRVRISNDSLNSYGFRVLTSGMDVAQYNRNPVLLYMHERGNVVGYVKDLKVENNEVTGELMFDCASELSQRCKKQFEFGSLRMVSAGLEILETSEDKELLVAGQTRPTITKSKLFEVSIADVGANDDALVLHKDGKRITLGRDGDCPLPLLNNINKQKTEEMENKTIALNLGLPETATEAEISAKIAELNAVKEQNASLLQEKEKLTLARINSLVEQAIADKRIELNNEDDRVDNWEITNGAAGYNSVSRHIVYVGGCDSHMRPKDTRTPAQCEALKRYVLEFHSRFPQIRIVGHHDLNPAKQCPSFNVGQWMAEIGIRQTFNQHS